MRRAAALCALVALLATPAAAARDALVGDAAERALLKAVRAEKFIRAREQAERILQKRPDSFIARYALARAFHDEEANLPRALYHARQAERWLLKHRGDPPSGELAKTWHKELLLEEETLLGELDRREEQIAVIDRHDAHYRPKLDYRRVWPLMKLGRFEEAARLAHQVSLSKDLHRRISGLNGMIAIEMERQRPRACYQVGIRAVESTGYRSCILLHNTAEAAFAVYRFDEVERLALRALKAPFKDCPSSSYTHLASLYLLRADFQRAMEAVRSAREQGVRRRYRQQFEMENVSWLFRLLYVLGKFDKAHELGQRMLRAPDRVGMTSTSFELRLLIAAVEHHAAIEAYAQSLEERASARPLGHRLGSWLQRRNLAAQAWAARRRATQLLAGVVRLRNLVRPYVTPLVPWNAGALIGAAGEGLVLKALAEARAGESMKRQTEPYFVALEAEVAHRGDDHEQALRLARRSLAGLPREEVLLRGRIEALAADAAWRAGHRAEAARRFHEVLHRFPTALRILGIRLPAAVRADAKPLSQQVARTLLRSRRLAAGASPFVVRVTTTAGPKGERVRICLEGSGGRRYACSEKELPKQTEEAEKVALAIDAFHERVFSPKVDLTQRDINSLDGSAVRGDADLLLEGVLGK